MITKEDYTEQGLFLQSLLTFHLKIQRIWQNIKILKYITMVIYVMKIENNK